MSANQLKEEFNFELGQIRQDSIKISEDLKSDTLSRINKINKFIGSLKADLRVEMDHAKRELGIGDAKMSSKCNLYVVSRLVEMILQHLMIK